MDNWPLRQTQARRLEYREGVKQRLYLGLFIVTALGNLVYQLFN